MDYQPREQLPAVTLQTGIHGLWIAIAPNEVFRTALMRIRRHGTRQKNRLITA